MKSWTGSVSAPNCGEVNKASRFCPPGVLTPGKQAGTACLLVSKASRLTKKSVPLLPRWYLAERPNHDLTPDRARSSQCFGKNFTLGKS
jgi:hypothetical protein